MRTVTTLAAVIISAVGINSSLRAETDYLAELYGEGVHYFYSGDLIQAEKFLDQAILLGTKDPRCYYYRALLHMCLGQCPNAEENIRLGAQYELEGRGAYDIGAALYRIQGQQRIEFEHMRRNAKIEVVLSGGVSAPSMDGTYLPTPLTIEPGIPPALTDPFADEREEIEVPVEDLEAEVGTEDAFGEEAVDGMFEDGAVDDAGLEPEPMEDDAETTEDDADPFAEDPFSVEDDDADGLFD